MATLSATLQAGGPGSQAAPWAVTGIDPSTFDLVARVKAGDTAAFYELIQPYQRSVFMAALGVVGNDADAEEIAQEAFLKALKYIHGFRQECKFSTWLIQIAINEARMRLRKDRRHLYDSIDETLPEEEGDYTPAYLTDHREIPVEALERKELREVLQQALAKLPEKYRAVLVLRDVEHLNTAETAKALRISEAGVKTRLCRARMQMRDLLLEMGVAR